MQDPQLFILQSDRVSRTTRQLLSDRLEKNVSAGRPHVLSENSLRLLHCMIGTMLPQEAIGTDVRIAEAIDARLGENSGIGWRFAELPPDREAYERGLEAVAEILKADGMESWESLPRDRREALLLRLQRGDEDSRAKFPLRRWLETLRVDAITMWMADPQAMAAISYRGFADGGDGWKKVGLGNGSIDTEEQRAEAVDATDARKTDEKA